MSDNNPDAVKGEQRWTKCLWCDKRVLLYYDQVDQRFHLTPHDWRAGERCANSGKQVFESEIQR